MVLELLISPQKAESRPIDLLFITMLFFSFAVAVALFIPVIRASVIIFTLIPSIPVIWNVLLRSHRAVHKHRAVPHAYHFEAHKPILLALSMYFFGAFLATVLWSAVLPAPVATSLFGDQLQEITRLQGLAGSAFRPGLFENLLVNNLEVLFLAVFFSILYGIGALYLILWNASVLGVFIGAQIGALGFGAAALSFARILPHGIPEMAGYILGSAGGAVLSVGLMTEQYKKPGFRYVVYDALILVALAALLIILGAYIESA